MQKRKRRVLIGIGVGSVAAATLALVVVQQTWAQQEHGEETPTVEPPAEARTVLRQTSGYQSWPRFADNRSPKRSEGHDNMFVLAFHNDVVGRAIEDGTTSLPDGSVIVKENRPSAQAPAMNLTVMAKRGGQWYWIKATPDARRVFTENGDPVAGRDLAACAGCHAQAPADSVFTHDLSR
jgi:hypothetical protein